MYDYDFFLRNVAMARRPKGKLSPDYVMVCRDNRLLLLESKGTASADPTRYIKHGKGKRCYPH